MGFLGNLINALVTAPVKVAGFATSVFGDLVGSPEITEAGDNMMNFNLPFYEEPVDLEDTTVEDTINVQEICDQTRNEITRKFRHIEDNLIDSVKRDIDKYGDKLCDVFPKEFLYQHDYSVGKAFEDDIHSTVSDYIAKNISTDSDRFAEILKITEDGKRKSEIEDYSKNLIDKVKKILQTKCKNKKIATFRRMNEDLEDFFTNQKCLAEEKRNKLQELQKHNNDIQYLENQAINSIDDLAAMESILSLTC